MSSGDLLSFNSSIGSQSSRGEEARQPSRKKSRWKGSKLNVWKGYKEGKERTKLEQLKHNAQLQERLNQEAEQTAMEIEEKLVWDIVELPRRNYERMRKNHQKIVNTQKKDRAAQLKDELKYKEEGFTFHNGVLKDFLRWRDSSALYQQYEGHTAQIFAFKFSEQCLLSASADTTLRLWEYQSAKCLKVFQGHTKSVRDCDLSPGFSLAAITKPKAKYQAKSYLLAVSCSADKTLRIWDARKGTVRKELKAHTDVVYACRFSPDGKRITSASADRTVRLWHALQGFLIYVFYGHTSPVLSVSFSASGKFLISASDFGERAIKLWAADMPTGTDTDLIANRIQWTRHGFIKRITLITNAPQALTEDPRFLDQKRNHSNRDPWKDLSDGEDEEESKYGGDDSTQNSKDTNKKLDLQSTHTHTTGASLSTEEEDEAFFVPDTSEMRGYSLSAVSIDRFNRTTRVSSYYESVWIQLELRGVQNFSGFFIGSYRKQQLYDAYAPSSGDMCGTFSEKSLPDGTKLTCDKKAITTTRNFKETTKIILWWKAPPRGTGEVVLHATIRGTDTENEQLILSYTLTEVAPPKKGFLLSEIADHKRSQQEDNKDATEQFSFKASDRHQIFIENIRNSEFVEASSLLLDNVRLKVQKGVVPGAPATIYRGQEAVMQQIIQFMANGVSFVRDARDIEPGKSMTVVIHSKPLVIPDVADFVSQEKESSTERSAGPTVVELREAENEVRSIARMRKRNLSCAEEVRALPGEIVRDAPLPKPPVKSNNIIIDNKFGGTLPHLQMKLPETYPRKVRANLNDDSARSGLEAMENAVSTVKSKRPVAHRKEDKLRQVKLLIEWTRRREEDCRKESTKRRHTNVELPGFENFAELASTGNPREAAARVSGISIPTRKSTDKKAKKLTDLQASLTTNQNTSRNSVAMLFELATGQRFINSSLTNQQPALSSGSSTSLALGRRHSFHNPEDDKFNIDTLPMTSTSHILRRSTFAKLPGLAQKQASLVSQEKDEERADTLARALNYGCIRTFAINGHAHHHTVNQVSWSLDEMRIASCSNDRTVRLWSPQTGKCVRTLIGHEDAVFGVSFSEDGLQLVSCGLDNIIVLWNAVNGRIIRRFYGHDDAIYKCNLFKNSSTMLSCSADNTIKAWILTPREPDAPKPPTITSAGDGKHAALVSWRAPPAYNQDITAYKLQYRIGIRKPFGKETSVDGSTFCKQIEALLPGQYYQFRVCAVNRMGQGAWSNPSKQFLTEVGLPLALDQPAVLRSKIFPTSITFCWHAPTATVAGTALLKFRLECSGAGHDFGELPDFTKVVSWKEAATLGNLLKVAYVAQITEEADIWKSTGPATRGRCPVVDEDKLQTRIVELDKQKAGVWIAKKKKKIKRIKSANTEETKQTSHLDEALSKDENQEYVNTMVAPTKLIERIRNKERDAMSEEERQRARLERFAALGRGWIMAATFDGLQPGHVYRVRVSGISSIGEGPASEASRSITTLAARPTQPAAPTGVGRSETSICVEWYAPCENGAAITKFELQQRDVNATLFFSMNQTHADFEGLEAGKSYTFRIRALNNCGVSEWSDYSKPIATLTGPPNVPDRPIILDAAIEAISISVPKPVTTGIALTALRTERRQLYRGGVKSEWIGAGSFTPGEGPAGTECTMIIEGLDVDSVFQFRCAAVNANGTSAWSLPSLRGRTLPAELPSAPSAPVIVKCFETFCDLAWTSAMPRGALIIGHVFMLKRTRCRRRSKISEIDSSTDDALDATYSQSEIGQRTEFRVENLAYDSKYAYQVAAINSVGQGPFSEWSSTFRPTPPSLFDSDN